MDAIIVAITPGANPRKRPRQGPCCQCACQVGPSEFGAEGGSLDLSLRKAYVKWLKTDELREELEARGLDKSGKKETLVERLENALDL